MLLWCVQRVWRGSRLRVARRQKRTRISVAWREAGCVSHFDLRGPGEREGQKELCFFCMCKTHRAKSRYLLKEVGHAGLGLLKLLTLIVLEVVRLV